MTSIKRNDMKSKFEAMRVNQPLRLPKEGSGFQPPTHGAETSEVSVSPQVFSTIGVQSPSASSPGDPVPSGHSDPKGADPLVAIPIGVEKSLEPVGPTPSGDLAQAGFDRLVELPSGPGQRLNPVSAITSGAETRALKRSPPYRAQRVQRSDGVQPCGAKAHAVESPLDYEPRDTLKSLRALLPSHRPEFDWKETGEGQLHIPHQMLEFAVKATSSRNELVLLLFFIRFTLGFRRGQFRVGYSFLSEWTGISDVTNLRKGLKSLMASGLVRKIEVHDSVSNTGAMYEVPLVCRYLGLEDDNTSPSGGGGGGKRSKTARSLVEKSLATENAQTANEPPASGLEDHGPLGELPTKKEKGKYNLKKTLSSDLPDDLRRQIERTRPLNKRLREVRSLRALLADYSTTEVSQALEFVKKEGVLHSGQAVHSPFSYLSLAIEEVLQVSKCVRGDQPRATPLAIVSAESEEAIVPWEEALSMFEKDLCDDQKVRCIDGWIEESGSSKFLPSQSIVRRLAAMRWYSDVKAGNRASGVSQQEPSLAFRAI